MTTSSSDSHPARAGRAVDVGSRRDRGAEHDVRLTVMAALPALTSLQHAALEVYGRLEPDRALVWTVEELGELAQAVRRHEDRTRLEEELGRLTAWMLCLANILDVDLAAAVESAIQEEIDRQLAKYGKLKPYSCESVSR
jgi:NTP pyrophosphatase (non-canonical NTP hydrolase)